MIPTIDISDISLNKTELECNYSDVSKKIEEALSGIGCMYLLNHGIPSSDIQEAFQAASKLFNLPLDRKMIYYRKTTRSPGYSQIGREKLEDIDIKEIKESFDLKNLPSDFFYPEDEKHLSNFHQAVEELQKSSKALALRILICLSKALGFEEEESFLNLHSNIFSQNNGSTFRLLHYPKKSESELSNESKTITRCGAHTDYGSFTFLLQDMAGGLQIQNLDEEWIDALPIKDAIFVNIGEILEFWSNGMFRATPHRVLGNEFDILRNSIVIFIHPDDPTDINPLMNKEESRTKESLKITAGEYLDKRLKKHMADIRRSN